MIALLFYNRQGSLAFGSKTWDKNGIVELESTVESKADDMIKSFVSDLLSSESYHQVDFFKSVDS